MSVDKKPFIITIDTEGDNLWGKPALAGVENARYLPRFQALCDEFEFKPTYLTNYEMARSAEFVALGREAIARGGAEIGCHIHAWDSPPEHIITKADHLHHPFLIEYPDKVIAEKLAFQTRLLEDTFGVKMLSHRAGRWAFDERYALALLNEGYLVDCSVTPGVSWRAIKGNPDGSGGTDYTNFPEEAYFIDTLDISKPGSSRLLEVPMTTRQSWCKKKIPWVYKLRGFRSVVGRRYPEVSWLRPQRGNREQMLALVEAEASRAGHLEFMIHSSEFMPGGSPYFINQVEVDQMMADVRQVFELVSQTHRGFTLSEFSTQFRAQARVPNRGSA
ncbi:polysaccharide deacetylase family protein [Roseateles albus]|uniref:Deacetylase n=1 Tax=Roseateles albus TaxID=2987525 RepID=A0ABT5KDR9_9BURK|nr:deacetylase [Roseateles albus]MDC8772076.1 deacetylase [Roseateles albus]